MNAALMALIEEPGHVCYRYRVQAFEPWLASRKMRFEVRAVPRKVLCKLGLFLYARKARVALLQRKLLSVPELWVLRRCSRKLVFDFDDAVYRRDSFDERGPDDWLRRMRFRMTMRAADVVVAGNDFLAGKALEAGAGNVVVLPTCIDMTRYPYDSRGNRRQRRDPLELVWIGSSSTLPSIAARRDLWDEVGRRFRNVRLKVICDRFPDFEMLPLKKAPWSRASEVRDLKSSHGGVALLPEDDWSRGKCGLKVLQYMAAGLPVIANGVGVQREMVANGWNGFVVDTVGDWMEAINILREEPSLAKRMGRRGRTVVRDRYDPAIWADRFLDILEG